MFSLEEQLHPLGKIWHFGKIQRQKQILCTEAGGWRPEQQPLKLLLQYRMCSSNTNGNPGRRTRVHGIFGTAKTDFGLVLIFLFATEMIFHQIEVWETEMTAPPTFPSFPAPLPHQPSPHSLSCCPVSVRWRGRFPGGLPSPGRW